MEVFDSRALKAGDVFGQVLSKDGKIKYRLAVPGGVAAVGGQTFHIEVRKTEGTRVQHFVKVYFAEGLLLAEPRQLVINSGDIVTWSADDGAVPPFRVLGAYDDGPVIDSGDAETEAFYSHAFGSAGETEWHDVQGSGVTGRIEVTTPKFTSAREHESYFKLLRDRKSAEKNVFHIKGKTVTPDTLSIVVGQTIFWVVEKTDGVAIASK